MEWRWSGGFGTADEVGSHLAERGETADQHEHLVVRWDAWEDWGWNPHGRGNSVLGVCDVPGCLFVVVFPPDVRP